MTQPLILIDPDPRNRAMILSDDAWAELNRIATDLQSQYGRGRGTMAGETLTGNEIEARMGRIRNPDQLREMWTSWNDNVGSPMRPQYARLTEIAKTESDPELRKSAIRSLGMHGKSSTSTLVELYAAEKDSEIKRSIINALGMTDDAAALVSIARRENDPALKREIVARLSHMPHSKVATDYLLEIINK